MLCCEFGLACLQFLRQQLRLGEQALGPHRRGDRVEHDTDRLHELVEETVVRLVEILEGGEFDDRLDLVLEQGRQDVDVDRRGRAQPRTDADEVTRQFVEADRPLVCRRLPDQAFTQCEAALQFVVVFRAIAGNQIELGVVFVAARAHRKRHIARSPAARART